MFYVARLEYYIMERVLKGTVGNTSIQFFALSGGAGGRWHNSFPLEVVNGRKFPVFNNPYFEALKTKGALIDPRHVHGGPIPPGWYWVRRSHVSRQAGRCAELVPQKGTYMMGRDTKEPFLIHAQGPHGSDGCIVPIIERKEFYRFMDLLDKDNGGTLYVDESIEGYRFA